MQAEEDYDFEAIEFEEMIESNPIEELWEEAQKQSECHLHINSNEPGHEGHEIEDNGCNGELQVSA